MYKAVIIDDDPVIRKGLKNVLDWESMGFSILGEAEDGRYGLDLFEKTNPDLIVTDIMMPNMNGLEMIEHYRNRNKDVKIIIVTAFRNFEYAKQALKIGVVDLVLKPTRINELSNAVMRAAKEIREDERKREELKIQEQLFRENLPALKEKFLHDFVFDLEIPDGSERERLDLFNIDLSFFYIIIIRFTNADELSTYNLYLRQIGISRLCEDVFKDFFNIQKIQFKTVQSAFLITPSPEYKDKNRGGYLPKLREILDEFITIVNSSINLEISIGLSSSGSGIKQLSMKYKEAALALEKIFFTGPSVVIEYSDDIAGTEKIIKTLVSAGDMEALILAVKSGNIEKVCEWFNSFASRGTDGVSAPEIRSVCGEIYWKILSVYQSLDKAEADAPNTLKAVYKSQSFPDICEIIRKFAVETATLTNSVQNKNIEELAGKCREYIKEHYAETLRSDDLASRFFVSTSYLRVIFKKVVGKNLEDYTNSVRIKRAIELIESSDLKSYQIAERVGIEDPSFFSRLFKKTTGFTPLEFKDRREKDK